MSQELNDKAVTYLRALESRDWDAARALCTDTTTVWHNDGKGEQSIEENIAGMEAQIDSIESMRYDILRQFSRPGEVLQQHVVHVATTGGMRGEVHAAVFFGFDDAGQIKRIEEYANFIPVGGQDS
ncbi:nuclear transport factor 2 family protein [Streptomyces cavernae]|uniref:nuclear transport factor 2 family protein n=1 Tax=Streptomyces cavernae TaxID=2259034 RepID=UPI000FEBFE51|nr:nuclear transport factor 2 family protein [Streptomyces cavernae]